MIATIPLLAAMDALSVGWVYVVASCSATLIIAFDAAQFAAIADEGHQERFGDDADAGRHTGRAALVRGRPAGCG